MTNPVVHATALLQVEKCKAAAAKKAPRASAASNQDSSLAEPQRQEGYNVAYVGNIAYDVTREELLELFRCSQISSCLSLMHI
jgi:RNA recognition motif-containing protein